MVGKAWGYISKKYHSDEEFRKKRNHMADIRHNKVRKCVKILCKEISKEKFIEIKCPVCEKIFGVTTREYNHSIKRRGYPPKYCSIPCNGIAHRKSWNEKSPYAKKIKELRKTHGV